MSRASHLEILPLGGLGEFGMNGTLLRHGDDALLIDAGMMFPGVEQIGVHAIVPDYSVLDGLGTLHGVVLTHGHDDHVGGLPALLSLRDLPVWGPSHAIECARRRVAESSQGRESALRPLPRGVPLELGPFRVSTLPASHSIPQAKMLVVETPAGVVVHSGDFKFASTLAGTGSTDERGLREWGDAGVLALLSDSTNATESGAAGAESTACAGIERILAEARGRVAITCFASNAERVAGIAAACARKGRKLAVVGAALENHVGISERLGLVRFPPGIRESPARLMGRFPEEVVLVVSGSQGEAGSSMRRIAEGQHPEVALEAGDTVIHSARIIPGNDRVVGRLFDRLLEGGIEVISGRDAPVHVSGHGYRDDLARLIDCVRPRHLLPIHGEYRQLDAHRRLAVAAGFDPSRVPVARSGDLLRVDEQKIEVVDRIDCGTVCVDESQQVLSPELLRERNALAREGFLVPVVTVRRNSGTIEAAEIVAGGFVLGAPSDTMEQVRDALRRSVDGVVPEVVTDRGRLEGIIRDDLRRFILRRWQRRPLILPLILES